MLNEPVVAQLPRAQFRKGAALKMQPASYRRRAANSDHLRNMPASKRKAGSSSTASAAQAVAATEGFSASSKKARKSAASYFDDEDEDDDSKATNGMMSAAMMDDMIDDDEDDDEDSGDGDEDGDDDSAAFEDLEAGPSTSRHESKPSAKNLYKPVTVEEMNTLRREGEERGGSFEFGMKVSTGAATLSSPLTLALAHSSPPCCPRPSLTRCRAAESLTALRHRHRFSPLS